MHQLIKNKIDNKSYSLKEDSDLKNTYFYESVNVKNIIEHDELLYVDTKRTDSLFGSLSSSSGALHSSLYRFFNNYISQNRNIVNYNENDNNNNSQQQFSLKEESNKQLEADYNAAVKAGNEAKAKEIVEQYANNQGYTEKVYHGTTNFGFTKLDTNMSDDKLSFFATNDPNIAILKIHIFMNQ